MRRQEIKNPDLKWLPPAEEWDFRSVTKAECRVACDWEYQRDWRPKASEDKKPYLFCPQNYRGAARELFPQIWLTLTQEQRQKVVDSYYQLPAIQVRKMRDFWKRMPVEGSNRDIFQAYINKSYVIIPNFSVRGVEAVIKAFEIWARKEAKQHPQSRRAQAAEPPFDALKWLAVVRLDRARKKGDITVEKARESVAAYGKANPVATENDTYPAYAIDGAWIKAVQNAETCHKKLTADPSHLLGELI